MKILRYKDCNSYFKLALDDKKHSVKPEKVRKVRAQLISLCIISSLGQVKCPTKCQAQSGSKLFDTLKVFLIFFVCEKVDFAKNTRKQKSMQ